MTAPEKWTLAKGGRSINAGPFRVRAEAERHHDVTELMRRLVRLPEIEAALERAGKPPAMFSQVALPDGDRFACSFCSKYAREVRKLIAGPRVFICDECVELCCEIIGEATITPDATERIAALTEEARTIRRRADDQDYALRRIAEHVARVLPRVISCMWCETSLDSEGAAREHVATCEQHPAVIKLRQMESI